MKTKILKWDVNIQYLLVVLNTVFICVCFFVPDFEYLVLIMQLTAGTYQLTSSAINLSLNHKSIGFADLRRLHFFGSIIYLFVLFGIITAGISNAFIVLSMFIIVPQIIFYSYFLLCCKELHFLQNREFHILR